MQGLYEGISAEGPGVERALGSDGSKRIAVVGGGMLGMTAALRLQKQGNRVVLFESAPHLGGLADAWRLGDVAWDRHCHAVLLSDVHLLDLLKELGLEAQMHWAETRTGFYVDGQWHSMSNLRQLLQFPPLNLSEKIRLGATIFHASHIKDAASLESIPATDWLQRFSGRGVLEKIWLPLLRANLGDSYTCVSAAYAQAIIARMCAARDSGLKKQIFGYPEGGYAAVLDRLGSVLKQHGVSIRCGHPVNNVEKIETMFAVEAKGGDVDWFDRVALTIAPGRAAAICPQLGRQERRSLQNIQYQGVVCLSVLLRRRLKGFYISNIADSTIAFTSMIEMTALTGPTALGGKTLVYLLKYASPGDRIFERSDEEIAGKYISGLRRIIPDLNQDEIVATRLSRVREVLPLPVVNYSKKLPAIETSLPGLFALNSAHIVNATPNVNEAVRLANVTCAKIGEAVWL